MTKQTVSIMRHVVFILCFASVWAWYGCYNTGILANIIIVYGCVHLGTVACYHWPKRAPTDEWIERRYAEIAASRRAATMEVIAKQGSYDRSGCSDCKCSAK